MNDPVDEHDNVPVSVRLGEVVPPEDPEDWTRPLTWIAAGGMLAAPLLGAVWFGVAAPTSAAAAMPATFLLAALIASGSVLTGLTQRGAARAMSATLGAALFAALALVVVGTVAAERQVGAAAPPVAHAFAAALGGLAGAIAAAPLMGLFAGRSSRSRLTLAPAAIAVGVAALVVPQVL